MCYLATDSSYFLTLPNWPINWFNVELHTKSEILKAIKIHTAGLFWYRVVWQMVTNASEAYTASIFRVKFTNIGYNAQKLPYISRYPAARRADVTNGAYFTFRYVCCRLASYTERLCK
jgi:hypothetical protein